MKRHETSSFMWLWFFVCTSAMSGPVAAREKQARIDKGLRQITGEDSRMIRQAVYGKGVPTTVPLRGPWASHTIVAVPTSLVELHKKKRLGVIQLLLDITRGGRPEDAIAAAALAVALEDNPVAALPLAYYGADCVDASVVENAQTGREMLIEMVQGLLSNAEKQERREK